MTHRIQKAAVLGAGTMGARIAAHFANAGLPCLLLDIVPKDAAPADRNKIVLAGLEAARKSRPAAFFTPALSSKIAVGNFEDDLPRIAEADWIIEVVAENLEIKRGLLAKVAQYRKPGAIVTTNTSGLPVHLIAEGLPEEFQQHWAGTHFFNPPRYMKLVEVIPGPKTSPDVLAALCDFCDRRLGKGVVVAKDTPNFIANRIGTYSLLNALRLMSTLGLTVEEVDACTGPAVGWPKSATFRTADIVGLDILTHVVKNIYETAPDDESREAYKVPSFVEDMARRGWIGDKTGQGFYKRVKGEGEKEILTLDLNTMEYRARQKARFASIETGKTIEDTRERLRALVAPIFEGQRTDKAQQFIWGGLSEMCLYAGRRMPEISDRIVDVDRAMRWGFAWELGPFEIVDALGLPAFAEQIKKEGRTLPPVFEKALASGRQSFYESEKGVASVFDLATGAARKVEEPAGILILKHLKEAGRVVERNSGASLIDLGDGVVCCEFHAKMNAIGADLIAMMHKGLKRLDSDFDAMVIANQATNFSVGANLMLVLVGAQEQEWDELHMAVKQFQNVNLAIKYAPKPVVAAPQGMALGGGCEIALHAAKIHAAAEAYIGLVEAGVGLIPGGGGTKEMLIRANENAASGDDLDLFHTLRPVFENIATAKVGTSAEECRELGYLRRNDTYSMNRERLVADAKQTALALARGGWKPAASSWQEGAQSTQIKVLGESFLAAAKVAIHLMVRGGYASDYDAHVARQLANILAGGALSAPQLVSEQYVLDLEREAFVSLCGEKKTQERIAHTLKTGKPLRN
ncbi:MAG TPA: 3-hydroxyacyl-CoA dehydrogenase NAD-binding domain-containing protein [Candidatus Acidoferrales bacterium]|nr:3-hydroxyacyl-CoA dehydrogenase NAD-binding domain-containing protein [Candidatus Acidoferrales bacterium]HXR33613.1 3-hydroxyacyl-CoA dehydrogenase NAD-binding domain-containing protein [Verrucomicrobiae bacterium]